MADIRLARVYDHEPAAGAAVYLVERLWPRGVRREDLPLDGWLKDAAPSPELRRWYGHDVAKWPEFRRRYRTELEAHPAAWRPIVDALAGGRDVLFLYAARDREHNSAVVLRDYLLGRPAGGRTADRAAR